MNTIAEFKVPAEEFALRQTLDSTNVTFEAERVTAHETDHVIPLLWVAGPDDDLDRIEDVLHEDPSVENAQLISSFSDERLYQMEWVKDVRFVVHMIVEEEAAILAASGSSDFWKFRVLFPSRAAVSETYDFCQRWELGITLDSIFEMVHERHGRFGLTKDQSEALIIALAHGYYDIPQEAHLDDLGDELGISRQAVSERLRRATKQLIQSTMAIGHEADPERKQ